VLRMLLGNVRVPVPARGPTPWPSIGSGDGSLDELRDQVLRAWRAIAYK